METTIPTETIISVEPMPQLDKQAIRSSLKASSWDGVFATIFTSMTGGVLLSNFLLQLGASPIEIGMVSSVPMVVNLLQPIGAYLSERTTSRRWYGIWIYAPARLLWLVLVLIIAWNCWHHIESHTLVILTLVMVLITNLMGAFGSASWLSWMAALVPQKLRGRYFGVRNSATSLTNLIGVPLMGLGISVFPGGTVQGYSLFLLLGVVAGLISLGCQLQMADVNPQQQAILVKDQISATEIKDSNSPPLTGSFEPNFLRFLFYVMFWAFAVNVSAPFFNLYLLDNLGIDVKWVTIYSSLMAGASLLMLVAWGKLADRIGNRPVLVLVGILVALTWLELVC